MTVRVDITLFIQFKKKKEHQFNWIYKISKFYCEFIPSIIAQLFVICNFKLDLASFGTTT